MELPRPAVIVALLTPYDETGAPDPGALRAHVDWLVEAGVDALMPCGTTGEGPLLADDEVAAVVRATVAAADGRGPVLAHGGRPGTPPTPAPARGAVDDGAAAVAAIVPYYYATPDDHVRAHYAALIDGVDVPVYAYTIPSHTHRELEPALLEQLIGDGLAGVKDSTKSAARHREYAVAARSAGAPFALYTGPASLRRGALRGGRQRGGRGAQGAKHRRGAAGARRDAPPLRRAVGRESPRGRAAEPARRDARRRELAVRVHRGHRRGGAADRRARARGARGVLARAVG